VSIFRSLFILNLLVWSWHAAADTAPLRLGVVGLTHDHVHRLFEREKTGDVEIVGIVEKNKDLARRYTERYGLSMAIVFDSMTEMMNKTKPAAVAAFGSTQEHLAIVETAAPRGVHVMVEKPLAINFDQAKKIKALAEKHHITVMVNYETTWYPALYQAADLLRADKIGPLQKVVVHDGHQGPKKIGVSQEFFDWLTDPAQNGAGALTDFGCYGVNLMTFLRHGARPETVTAVVQHLQPNDYPKVEDDATIILTYPGSEAVIQASWDWPISRKDMELYGSHGYVMTDNQTRMRTRLSEADEETTQTVAAMTSPINDPFAYFKGMIDGSVKPEKYDPSTLDNNMIVMEILDAAITSAKLGRSVRLP